MQDKKWHTNKNKPIDDEPNIPVPTAPIMKSGPELFVKARSLSASCFVRDPFFLRSAVILAPTGYPDVTPRARAKEAQPGTLKNGLITGSSKTPAAFVKPVEFISSLATKKGNREGTTMDDHKIRPFKADLTAVFEKMTRHIMKSKHNAGIDKSLIYMTFDGCTTSTAIIKTAIIKINDNIIGPTKLLMLLKILFLNYGNIPDIN